MNCKTQKSLTAIRLKYKHTRGLYHGQQIITNG